MKGVNAIQNFKMKQLRLSESSRNRKDSDSRDFREYRAKKKTTKAPFQKWDPLNEWALIGI